MTGFSKAVIYRNGVLIDSNVTTSPYTDPAVLDPNTSYIYKILAYDSSGTPGTYVYKTIVTLPTLTSLTVSSVSASQISLAFIGQYSYLNIYRNGAYVATNITGTTFTDTGLSQDYSYTYVVTPYNSSGDPGTALSITQFTLQSFSSLTAVATSSTQIDLTYAGSYANVSITRDGTPVATNITGTTFSDTGLTTNTSYTYVITPYNESNVAGNSSTISKTTLSSLTAFNVSSFTASQIVLTYAGSYSNVSITRNGTAISAATNITGTTFTDTGLSANTSYVYVITPNNSSGAGSTLSITQLTLGNITSLIASAISSTQIDLTFAGSYTNVNITRNSISIATNITGTTFSDTGLTAHTSYTYVVTPNNSSGAGATSSITKGTLPDLTSLSVSSFTASQIVLTYAGSYTNVSITRNGTAIATNITGTTITDTGLSANTSYTYVVTPNNTSGAGSTLSITKYTLANITSLSVSSETTAQTVLAYSGNYTNVSITRNGTAIATNITGNSYTDTGLSSNTSYTYVVTPFNVDGVAGATSSIINVTLPYIVSLSVSSQTSSQIVLTYSGSYTNVSITRDGTAIATNVTGTSFTDTGLTTNTSYTYILTPYNSDGEAGASSTISHSTLGLITSVSATSESTTQILLTFSGTYTNVSITRNGTSIATNITGTTFTDTGLTVNTSYTYILTPYNVNGVAGATSSISIYTLPNIVSFGLFSSTSSQIVLQFSGNYTSVNIARGGSPIASGVTTATYTDTGLSSNTSYTYVVTPVNPSGVGASSGITILTLPNAPAITGTVSSTTAVSVSFTTPSGAGTITGYTVTSSPGGLTGTGASPISVSGLTANTIYTFTVSATNSAGTSVASSASTATTRTIAPTIGTATVYSSTVVSVGFTAPSGGNGIITNYTATSSPGGLIGTENGTGNNIIDSSNLVLYYPFNSTDLSGTTIANWATGSPVYDASMTGTTTITSNQTSTLTAGTTKNGVLINRAVPRTGFTGLTFSFWFTATSIPSSTYWFLTTLQDALGFPSGNRFFITINQSNTLSINNQFITSLTVVVNTLYHIVVTINSTGSPNTTVYVNNVSQTGNCTYPTFTNVSGYNSIGRDPLGNGLLGTLDDYRLYNRSITATEVNTLFLAGRSTTTSFSNITVPGLTANTIYTFSVTATNSGGTSASSSASTAVTTRTNAPIIGTATVLSATVVTVTFTAPSGGNGTIINYTVTSSPGGLTRTGTSTSLNVTGLTANTAYTFTVIATNSGGASLSSSASNSVVTLPVLTELSSASTLTTSTQITLTYKLIGARVSISRNGTILSSNITTPTYTDTGLTLDSSYAYIVTPFNSPGVSGTASSIVAFATTYTALQQLMVSKSIWGKYSASSWNSGTNILTDLTGNGRDATTTNVSSGTGTGNGITATIPFIGGTTTGTVLWPINSISSTFTIASINRYSGSNRGRILHGKVTNWLHGHWSGTRGVAYYEGWKVQSSVGTVTNWLNMVGTNGTNISIPNNIIADGTARGESLGGSGSDQLEIGTGEPSDFQFSQLLIWQQGMTSSETIIVANAFTSYLSDGLESGISLPVPIAPIIQTVTVINSTSVSVPFKLQFGSASYTVTSSPGGLTGTGTTSPITVSGLTSNTAYTFTMTSTNVSGTSVASSVSNTVTTL